MLRNLLVLFLTCAALTAVAQPYRNEWIDYQKTYYKFPVANQGLFRITKTTLASLNLGETNAEDFQLWRDGKEQPIYTTEPTGPLAANGYIEFYGRPLDGTQDDDLFPNPQYHVYKDLSYFSDTAFYYLTVNPGNNNLRFTNAANDVANTTLLPDSFFMHTNSINFFRGGFSYNYSYGYGIMPEQLPSQIVIRSSIWDQGEGFASTPFNMTSPLTINMTAMQAFKNGPPMKLYTSVLGAMGGKVSSTNYSYDRTITVSMNDSLVWSVFVQQLNSRDTTIQNIPLSRIINDAISFRFGSDRDQWPERAQANALYLTYPRIFNFGNTRIFAFNLPANSNGNHLRIGKFLMGAQPAILLDLTNLKRYTAVSKGADSSLVAIAPSSTDRQLVLANQVENLRLVTAAQIAPVVFTDYSKTENQGDYLIITSNRLRMYNGNDMVETYRQYRSSTEGGGFNAKVVDIEQLYDQYALGVRKNPLSIRRFIQYAAGNFAVKPKFVLLLGRGVDYLADRYSGNYQAREYQNSIPTWGSPPSDNLLAAGNGLNPTPLIPIGRVAVVSGKEISDYLDKVKQFESLAASDQYLPENKDWRKQALQLAGGNDTTLAKLVTGYLKNYAAIIADTFYGAQSRLYVKTRNPNYANEVKLMTERINKGVGLISYFGHSSSSSIDFNLSSPDDFTNTGGKYPVFIANGCQGGNIFFINANRMSYYGLSISDRFVLAPNKGSIAFISNSDNGLFNYLNIYTTNWMRQASNQSYGKGLGVIHQMAVKSSIDLTGTSEFYNRMNTEQAVLHGDPAIRMFSEPKPDYTITDSLVTITPVDATVAEDSLQVKVVFLNLGKAIYDTVWVDIRREFADGSEKTIATIPVKKLMYRDSVMIKIPVKGIFDKGTNYIVATIDPANQRDEMSETNNTARIAFEVSDEEIRPVYPYNFSIVNHSGFHLKGSTVNAIQGVRVYRLQVDTTEKFNSPLLYTKDTSSVGGAVEFNPNLNWVSGRVYYWRLAPVFNGIPVNWRSSSFQYLPGPYAGWGQSHFYQHTKSTYSGLSMDSSSRMLKFGRRTQNLYIVNSVYNYSGDEDLHFSITRNGLSDIYSACIGRSIIFNVFDTLTFQPWLNLNQRYGSASACDWGRQYNFEFQDYPASNRKTIMDFIDSIPKGMIVTARLILDQPFDSALVQYWKKDTAIFGSGKSLYHSLYRQGFYKIDSMYKYRTFSAVFKKDDSLTLKPASVVSDGLYDRLNTSYFVETTDSTGNVQSPVFGPSIKWYNMQWMGHQPPVDSPTEVSLQVIGIDKKNKETVLKTFAAGAWDNDLSDIDAAVYPNLKLKMITKNAKQAQPYQLDYWRIFYEPVADGALSARDSFAFNGPLLLAGKDNLHFAIAFKNVGPVLLDSCSVRVTIANRDGNEQIFDLRKTRPLAEGDTAMISFDLGAGAFPGRYYAYIQVNREKNPAEQSVTNNATYIPFEIVTVLPATLLDFTAKPENNSVRLDWTVTNEKEVSTYFVEHSGTNSSRFTTIGNVAAKNTGKDATYTLLHNNPVEGANYYRIKTAYKNGSLEVSPIRQVIFSRDAKLVLYPNPFRDNIFVQSNGAGNWTLEMFTVLGQRLLTDKGSGSKMISTSKLPAGTYMVRVTDKLGTSTMKFEKHY